MDCLGPFPCPRGSCNQDSKKKNDFWLKNFMQEKFLRNIYVQNLMNFIWEMKSKLWNVNLIAGGKQIKYQIAGLTLDSADEQPAPFSLPVVAAWSPPPRDQATSRWAGPGQPTTCPAAPWTRTCTGHCHTSPTYRGDLETDQVIPPSPSVSTVLHLCIYDGCCTGDV